MSATYQVPPKTQPSQMTCVPTAIWMMHSWYLRRKNDRTTKPLYDALVIPGPQANAFPGIPDSAIADEVRADHLSSASIALTIEAFDQQLRSRGPFVYVEKVKDSRLPIGTLRQNWRTGRHLYHALLVTGLTQTRSRGIDITTLYFNDPATGRSESLEIFKFLLTFGPFNGDTALVIFMNNLP